MAKRNINVAVRIRPFLPQDNDKASDSQLLQTDGKNRLRLPLKLQRERERHRNSDNREEKVFSFDHVFTAQATQTDVYKDTGMDALVAQTRSIEKVARLLGVDNLEPDTADHTF